MSVCTLFHTCVVCLNIRCVLSASVYFTVNKAGLTDIPGDVWPNTTHLILKNNEISTVSPGTLADKPTIIVIDLSSNSLTHFPRLCEVGATLTRLVLASNGVLDTVLPDDNLQCLEVLTTLDLSNTGIVAFPDLTPLGDTLETLYLRSLSLTDPDINAAVLEPLTELRRLYLGRNSLTRVPAMQSQLGSSLTVLHLDRNDISITVPEDFLGYDTLQELNLAHNHLTEFPNLTHVGDSLTKVYVQYNHFSQVSPLELLAVLSSLRTVGLGGPLLSTLPSLSALNDTLVELTLEGSTLPDLPDLQAMGLVSSFDLTSNQHISAIPDGFFRGWHSLKGVYFPDTPIKEFPNLKEVWSTLTELDASGSALSGPLPVDHLATLQRLKRLDLSRLPDVTGVPTTCPEDVGAMVIDLRGCGVDLCACAHLWLKAAEEAGAVVKTAGGTVCGGGEPWDTANVSRLAAVCTGRPGQPAGGRPGWRVTKAVHLSLVTSFCGFPNAGTYVVASRARCMEICMNAPGCVSFNYRRLASGHGGECVPVAPSAAGHLPASTPSSAQDQATLTPWKFYSLLQQPP